MRPQVNGSGNGVLQKDLLYLLVCTFVMIGRFNQPYFTEWPNEFKSLCELKYSPLYSLSDKINILLTFSSQSVL